MTLMKGVVLIILAVAFIVFIVATSDCEDD